MKRMKAEPHFGSAHLVFQLQHQSLMEMLSGTEPHYVSYDDKVACQMIFDKMGLQGYQIGKTKVFSRAGLMAELDARRTEVLGNASRKMQRRIRTYFARRDFVALRDSVIPLQALCRYRMTFKQYEQFWREAAALIIQTNLQQHVARKGYWSIKLSAITLQIGLRTVTARQGFRMKKRTKAAIHIQTKWRCHHAYAYYKKLYKAALATQCGWRCRVARRVLRNLKMAARETGALKEDKDKLEKRVEELTWRLQLEKRLPLILIRI